MAGLVIDPNMHGGFLFEVHDLQQHKKVTFRLSLDEMEYTTMPQVQERLAERFEGVPEEGY